ncbi:MAG: HD domain-containing protein, partial [Lachnospiraceae bacterium]|nr:HD domain-containing protein [Lachnospiraceae bacterium]
MYDRDTLLHDNRVKANYLVTKCMRYILVMLLVIWLANIFGLFGMDKLAVTICFASCGLIMLTPTLFIDVLNVQHKIVNYMVILCTVLAVGMLAAFLSYYVYPLMLFPLFIASMYCDRSLVIFAAISNCVMAVVSSVSGIYVSLTEQNLINIKDVKAALTYIALPTVCIVIGMSVIAFFIVDRNSRMLNEAIEGKLELQQNQKELIYAFAEISENKSKFTGEHIKRVAEYMKVLGRASGFTEEYVEKLATASMMHDIGKLMIPEEILDKPSKLTDEEFEIMKNHVLYGEALLHNTT